MDELKPIIKLEVSGETFEKDFTEELEIGRDLGSDMNKVAVQIAYAGAILGTVKELLEKNIIEYRNWRASVAKKLLVTDPKMAEWKVKVHIESMEGYVVFKERIAEMQRLDALMSAVLSGFKHKSELLRSRSAMAKAELTAME